MRGRMVLGALLAALMAAAPAGGEERIRVDVSNRPYLGPEDAPVTIVEFLDFQ